MNTLKEKIDKVLTESMYGENKHTICLNWKERAIPKLLSLISQDREELCERIEKEVINVHFSGLDNLNFKPRAVVKELRKLQRQVLSLIKPNTPPNAGD